MNKLFAVIAVVLVGFTASAASACPDWRLDGRTSLGTLTGSYLSAPRSWNVQAGGNNNLTNCEAPGNGWVISDPDFELSFQNDGGYGRLAFAVVGNCDTVLLINDANGQWHFNDDSAGLNPAVTITNPPNGIYDVWVGTYGTTTCPAQIEIATY